MAVVTILLCCRRTHAPPKIARLLASVPPEVKTISSGRADSAPATALRAAFSSCSARNPNL